MNSAKQSEAGLVANTAAVELVYATPVGLVEFTIEIRRPSATEGLTIEGYVLKYTTAARLFECWDANRCGVVISFRVSGECSTCNSVFY